MLLDSWQGVSFPWVTKIQSARTQLIGSDRVLDRNLKMLGMLVSCITLVIRAHLHMWIRLARLVTEAHDVWSSEHNSICFPVSLWTSALMEGTDQMFIRADYSRTREAEPSQYFLYWDSARYSCHGSLFLEGALAKLMVGIPWPSESLGYVLNGEFTSLPVTGTLTGSEVSFLGRYKRELWKKIHSFMDSPSKMKYETFKTKMHMQRWTNIRCGHPGFFVPSQEDSEGSCLFGIHTTLIAEEGIDDSYSWLSDCYPPDWAELRLTPRFCTVSLVVGIFV